MKKIYVVEDEAVVALELEDHLRQLGYEPCGHAPRAEVALREIPVIRPDLVLMDVNLGKGMNGIELAEQLRRTTDVPVVFVTAYSDARLTERAARTGSFGYVVKPFLPLVLRANLEMAFARCELERELQLTQFALEQSAEAFHILDSDARFIRVNEASCRLLGYSRQELLEMKIHDVDPNLSESTWAAYLDELREKRSLSFESEARGKNGTVFPTEISISLVSFGGSEYNAAVIRDITARKQREHTLRVISNELAPLAGPAFYEEVATQLSRISGLEIAFVDLIAPGPPERVRTLGMVVDGVRANLPDHAIGDALCSSTAMGKPVILPSGARLAFHLCEHLENLGAEACITAPFHDANKRPIGCVGVLSRRPIAHPERVEALAKMFAVRVSAEFERERADSRFRDLFEFAPDAVVMLDAAGKLTMANRQAETLFGYDRAELLRRHFEDLIPSALRLGQVDLRARLLEGNLPQPLGAGQPFLEARRKDGSAIVVDIGLSPFTSYDGLMIIAMVRDVSERVRAEAERKRLEAELAQVQRVQTIGTLAGGVAHDFNNLLAMIFGHVELMRRDLPSTHPSARRLDDIQLAAERGRKLIQQILAFGRREGTSRAPLNLRASIEESLALFLGAMPPNIELAASYDAAAPLVIADSTQVHQVILNLCTNAWHAYEGRAGRIEIGLEAIELGAPEARALSLPAGRYAKVTVSDSGKGMDPSTLARVFEPFFTTKSIGEGTGLGLSVVHGIVTSHGGAVSVTSRPGDGTSFQLYWPAANSEATVPLEPASAHPPAKRGRRVLYIDDERVTCAIVKESLERLGYHAVTFDDARAAAAELSSNATSYDVLITDLNMPYVSGLEIIEVSRAARAELPVLVVSGYVNDDVMTKVRSAGARVLYKPWASEQLVRAVEQMLTVGSAEPAPLGARGRELLRTMAPEQLAEITELYAIDGPKHAQDLLSRLDLNDLEAAGFAAHSLAGSSSFIGGDAVDEACRQAMRLIELGQTLAAREAALRVVELVEQLIVSLRASIKAHSHRDFRDGKIGA